ncbi:MAG: N-acetylmuramic acid 6-phosphate etherase [Verrucomicrobia bacterium]|nr:N-acetylmuramic acid 6-phosphate etherase [Verrucomicrobiota bacterium]
MSPVLGIEGGGTKSSWVLIGTGGRILAQGTVGPANIMLAGREGLRKVFQRIAASLPAVPIAIGGGFAGARGQPELATARAAIRAVWPKAKQVVVGPDTDSALAAAWGKEDGFLVIAGTGSNVIGRKKGGRFSAGGHGHLLGDAGSGYDLVQRAIEAVFRERDREGKAPALAAVLLAHAGAADLDRLLREVYRPRGKEWLATFAPVVLRAAGRGDRLAGEAVRAGAGELAERAAELARRMGVRRPRIALRGGLFDNSYYRSVFLRALRRVCPGAVASHSDVSGAVGAARMCGFASTIEAKRTGADERAVDVEALPTERANPRSRGLHKKSVNQLVRLFLSEEARTGRALLQSRDEITRAARLVSQSLKVGGRLFYAGAGTSGRLGVLDASEIPPTFHAPAEQVQAILAGGPEAIFRAQEGAEDDEDAGGRAVMERKVGRKDVVVGLTASGRTPFVHGALAAGKRAGAKTVLVTAHPKWMPVRGGIRPDAVIRLDVGPELIAGSTRLKAGTATKVVCNTLSSVAMIRLGRVHDNLMVHVVPSNEKLRARAVRLIRILSGANIEEARRALMVGGGRVMRAVKILRRGSRLRKRRGGARSRR